MTIRLNFCSRRRRRRRRRTLRCRPQWSRAATAAAARGGVAARDTREAQARKRRRARRRGAGRIRSALLKEEGVSGCREQMCGRRRAPVAGPSRPLAGRRASFDSARSSAYVPKSRAKPTAVAGEKKSVVEAR